MTLNIKLEMSIEFIKHIGIRYWFGGVWNKPNAKSYFDVREYDRAAHLVRNDSSPVPRFLHLYATYMALEKRRLDSTTDQSNVNDSGYFKDLVRTAFIANGDKIDSLECLRRGPARRKIEIQQVQYVESSEDEDNADVVGKEEEGDAEYSNESDTGEIMIKTNMLTTSQRDKEKYEQPRKSTKDQHHFEIHVEDSKNSMRPEARPRLSRSDSCHLNNSEHGKHNNTEPIKNRVSEYHTDEILVLFSIFCALDYYHFT
uniref:Cdc23 domain-containing protein n=1 Tax=Glossina palpalis gambiensis TaxID=67801 RepID=A0A1B0BXN6_9MUSC